MDSVLVQSMSSRWAMAGWRGEVITVIGCVLLSGCSWRSVGRAVQDALEMRVQPVELAALPIGLRPAGWQRARAADAAGSVCQQRELCGLNPGAQGARRCGRNPDPREHSSLVRAGVG